MTDKHPLKVLNQLWDTQDTYKNPYDLPKMHFLKNLTQKCGSQERKQTDWITAMELTESLRQFDPEDPVKYDFALFGLGIEEEKF